VSVRARQVLLFILCCAFAAQTWLVYADPEGTKHSLSPIALEGQEIWRENNCQSCHQLFGFGGFLGPDLTNSIKDLSPERLTSILTEGLGQMPAFELDADEQHRIVVFLEELDATGISQPKLGELVSPAELLSQVFSSEAEMPAEVVRGAELLESQGCIGCHLPNKESLHLSTDLTLITDSRTVEEVQAILHDGIEGTAMPRLSMSAEDAAAVWACMVWMNERGDAIRGRFSSLATSEGIDLTELPWFEYE